MDLCDESNEAAFLWLKRVVIPRPDKLGYRISTTDLFYRYQCWVRAMEKYRLLPMEDFWGVIQIGFPKTEIVGKKGNRAYTGLGWQ